VVVVNYYRYDDYDYDEFNPDCDLGKKERKASLLVCVNLSVYLSLMGNCLQQVIPQEYLSFKPCGYSLACSLGARRMDNKWKVRVKQVISCPFEDP
jgi:hypothetical protein